jgi:hypothetical protein
MSTQRKRYSAALKARVALEALKGQGFQHVWRRCRAQSLCGRTTKLPPRTGYEKDGHGATIWQLVQQ